MGGESLEQGHCWVEVSRGRTPIRACWTEDAPENIHLRSRGSEGVSVVDVILGGDTEDAPVNAPPPLKGERRGSQWWTSSLGVFTSCLGLSQSVSDVTYEDARRDRDVVGLDYVGYSARRRGAGSLYLPGSFDAPGCPTPSSTPKEWRNSSRSYDVASVADGE
ncbi:hypothetical protein WOLCODRAFT_154380 [Wolfiporia cocos MD-104 SS10]|uniref:Uncharacterized protein n=1 Tax=Wolfiporia cocos (strain MD-104) TaxID=742152 RepID=A0A2H3JZM1_WOLCO|nr:hypothetical protein WOLCODRAFT_154380 [Wolfiporia cocos MD-104 SS10]